ncbi:hypothetical protein KAR91_62280 [Candidatus Pacearchaeota archaeon]|nr:hypothetical protein [Candidatus Pacearchaeota archaeon]
MSDDYSELIEVIGRRMTEIRYKQDRCKGILHHNYSMKLNELERILNWAIARTEPETNPPLASEEQE